MRFLRLLTILSVFFYVAHSNAMATDLVVAENELNVSAQDTHSGTHDHCCIDRNDHTPDCHIFASLIPVPANGQAIPETSADVSAENGIVPDGVEPAGPLDPPRNA